MNPWLLLFLCGDVMTGRGIDQVLPHPNDPTLYERHNRDARAYVAMAEERHGPIPRPVDFAYIWGDALAELDARKPAARIVNLETAVTTSDDAIREKPVLFRMHPRNVGCLAAAGVDVCALSNNHALDWGVAGLVETLATLRGAGIRTAGADLNADEAAAPAVLPLGERSRLLVFCYGSPSSGVVGEWAAGPDRPGVNVLARPTEDAVRAVAAYLADHGRPGDIVVFSLHWGSNWGYAVPPERAAFARALIDAGVDIVHGHSSHHVRPLEVYKGRLILYGCGDLINDYEGIARHEEFRGDLSLMYFPSLDPDTGELKALEMVPVQVRNFRVNRAAPADAAWLRDMLNRESLAFGTQLDLRDHHVLTLRMESH